MSRNVDFNIDGEEDNANWLRVVDRIVQGTSTRTPQVQEGRKGWVTIGGNHVFIGDAGSDGGGGGGGTAVAPTPAFTYTPAQGLTPAQQEVQKKFGDMIAANPQAVIADYKKQFGNVLSADNAKEMSPDYAASNESRSLYAAAVHEPASALTKMMYAQDLAAPTPPGKDNLVLFTAGGAGAGKSSGLADTSLQQLDTAKIIYDTNMSNTQSSFSKIDQALATDTNVSIAYVNRDPMQSFADGVLPRAESEGRTVPLSSFVDTHVGALQTVQAVEAHYADNPHVSITVIDNNRGLGEATIVPTSTLDNLHYDRATLTAEATSALEKSYAHGTTSQAVYNGILGKT